jgi:aspartyl-tRNA(Asn)/glutamyl-tRNA(Gln) amidotransferase subunit A
MSLNRFANVYLANHAKYTHLNAFVSRVNPSLLSKRQIPGPYQKKDDATEFSLHAVPIAVKDNICTKDLKTTAASAILKDYTSPYDATVVTLLQNEGAVVVGKTNMDEFGMGSHSTHSHAGPVKLQRYEGEEASAGGSSGGSALAVASGQCWAALGTDTGGSIRLPAAYTGVVGFKPSYGLLSRRGVIAYANSLDTVGILSQSARDIERLFEKLNVHDPQDPTSLPPSARSRLISEDPPSSLRIGIPLDYNIVSLHPSIRNSWVRALRALAEKGHTLHPVRLAATQHALSTYYVLAPAEASSNLAKYDGVRYGSRAEGIDGTPESALFAKTRAQGFGPEVQRRILLGAFTLSAQAIDNYFIQSQKVRRLVQQDFNNVFAKANPLVAEDTTSESTDEKVDVLLCPTAPTLAPSLSEVKSQDPLQAYMNDLFTVPASLAGLPAISVPLHITDEECRAIHGDHKIEESVGIQIIGQYGDDKLVLRAAQALQAALPTRQFKNPAHMTAWGASLFGEASRKDFQRYGAVAFELGISIAEARPIAQQRRAELVAKTDTILRLARGRKHLNRAADAYGMPRDAYIAKFAGLDDPVAAEAIFSAKGFQWKANNDAQRMAKRVALPGSELVVRGDRLTMLTPFWARNRGNRRNTGKSESPVRFVGFGAPLPATELPEGAEKLKAEVRERRESRKRILEEIDSRGWRGWEKAARARCVDGEVLVKKLMRNEEMGE